MTLCLKVFLMRPNSCWSLIGGLVVYGRYVIVLEKYQFIDKERLQKYLKGRQRQGSADNLPILSTQKSERNFEQEQQAGAADMGIIYRALVEMGSDISDVKKMLAKFLYSTFADKNI